MQQVIFQYAITSPFSINLYFLSCFFKNRKYLPSVQRTSTSSVSFTSNLSKNPLSGLMRDFQNLLHLLFSHYRNSSRRRIRLSMSAGSSIAKIAEGERRPRSFSRNPRKVLRGGFSLTKPRDIQTAVARKFFQDR